MPGSRGESRIFCNEEKRQEILFLPWSFARAGSVLEPMPGVPASQIVAA